MALSFARLYGPMREQVTTPAANLFHCPGTSAWAPDETGVHMSQNKIAKLRDAAFVCQNGQCIYCGCQMVKASAPRGSMQSACTAEHLIPKSEGGGNTAVNIKAACRYCNHTRHKMNPVLSPEAYRHHVRRRLAKGKWHCESILRETSSTDSSLR